MSQATPPTSLFLSDDEWDHLAARLDDPFFAALHEANERAVAVMLNTARDSLWRVPMDLREPGDVRDDDERWRILKHRLLRFTLSWRLAGREDSLAEALRTVDELLEPKHWTAHYLAAGIRHADLKTADLWYDAVFAREALWPKLSKEQRTGLETLLTEWALPAYLRGWEDSDWWLHAEFNWGASVHGGAGFAALAVRELVPDLAEDVLARVREGLDFVIEAMPLGGGWIEGMMYQATTLGHLTDFAAALHRVTGADLGLTANRRLHDAFDFRMQMLGGDENPINFSNCNERSSEWRLPHAYWWAARCDRPDWAGFESAYPKPWWDTHGVFLDIEAFWMREPNQPETTFSKQPGLAHAREIDWLTWNRGEMWFGLRCGFNGGNHCNLDLGQIVFGWGEERILCDPGYGAASTSQHSCVTLAGKDQANRARARTFRTREWDLEGEHILYTCSDLSDAYGTTLHYHYRHCIAGESGFLLILDDLLVRDGLRAAAAGHLQIRAEPELTDTAFTLAEPNAGFRGHFLTPTRRVSSSAWTWRNQPVHTLSYRCNPDRPRATMAVLLARTDLPENPLTLRQDTATFTHAGKAFQIDLTEGSCIPRGL